MTNPTLFPNPVPALWTPDKPLRALSWKQPYAELMLHNKIETRTWGTAWRGWVMICASKAPYKWFDVARSISGDLQYRRIHTTLIENPSYSTEEMDLTGHAIAIGHLSDCRLMTPADEDAAFVQYRSGLWCHVYTGVRAIAPMPWKGSQGWREVPQDFKNQIKFLEP